MPSCDSRLGAIGRAAWAICSCVRRAAREALPGFWPSVDSEGFISAAAVTGRFEGIGCWGKEVDVGAEVESDTGYEKG